MYGEGLLREVRENGRRKTIERKEKWYAELTKTGKILREIEEKGAGQGAVEILRAMDLS